MVRRCSGSSVCKRTLNSPRTPCGARIVPIVSRTRSSGAPGSGPAVSERRGGIRCGDHKSRAHGPGNAAAATDDLAKFLFRNAQADEDAAATLAGFHFDTLRV